MKNFYQFKTDYDFHKAGDLICGKICNDDGLIGYRWLLSDLSHTCPVNILEQIEITIGTELRLVNCSTTNHRYQEVCQCTKIYENYKADDLIYVRFSEGEYPFEAYFVNRFRLCETPLSKKCVCDIFDLMARGCQCGGI